MTPGSRDIYLEVLVRRWIIIMAVALVAGLIARGWQVDWDAGAWWAGP
jgi:hypothetical protein